MPIPHEVEHDLGGLILALRELGAELTDARYDGESFGNYEASFRAPNVAFRITRDRSQYILQGPCRKDLEQAGLWRAFDHRDEFQKALIAWLRTFAA